MEKQKEGREEMSDELRAELTFALVCANCGDRIVCSSKAGGIGFGSAFQAEATMAVVPCPRCIGEAKEPADALRKLIAMVSEKGGTE
jgi:hypothetical protein